MEKGHPMSVTDVIALITLLVTLQAGFFAIHMWLHKRYRRRQDAQIKSIIEQRFHIEEGHKVLREALIEYGATIGYFSSILTRLLAGTDQGIRERASKEFSAYNERLTKVTNDLLLLGHDKTKRNSAIQQLSQAQGDLSSYELMLALHEHEGKKDPILASGINILRQRLSDKLESNKECGSWGS
jgi:hypothetical protein